jgi:amino acid transporter/nucleotide-binding universal stress UspA family protein
MLVSAESRPRNLSAWHAGPLLFGDWGTSRLYVLGLAFYFTGHASPIYLGIMSLIMVAVAWGYTIVCRCFPDGGGVYAAAKKVSPLLAVIAATLLICDFIVTAALSAVEAFHYFGMHGKAMILASCIGTIFVLGVLNWFGSKAAGRFALLIAIFAIAASAIVGAMCLKLLPDGLAATKWTVPGVDDPWERWTSLVRIVLALAGVEAVASMTGLMKQPVARTSRRTIWPVLIEVIALNMLFGIAINALPGRLETTVPDYVRLELGGVDGTGTKFASDFQPVDATYTPTPEETANMQEVKEYRSTALRVLAEHVGTTSFGPQTGHVLGIGAGIVFGLLLLSAVNTAILALVSVFYALGQDKELPQSLTKLNYSGVPWIGLIISVILPAVVLLIVSDDKALGELYAIGVVGAIAINMTCCALNKELEIKGWERMGLWAIAILMTAIFLTIVVAKPNATLFAGVIVGSVLIARYAVKFAEAKKRLAEPLPTPHAGWLAELPSGPVQGLERESRIMLAARGRANAEYAVDLARKRKAALFAIYVRTLRVLDVTPGQAPRLESDPEAQETLGTVAVIAKRAGVPFVPIYVTSPNIAEEILDYTVTFACDTLIIGKSQRGTLARKVGGDVVRQIADTLPEGVSLIARSTDVVQREPAPSLEAPSPAAPPAHDANKDHKSP